MKITIETDLINNEVIKDTWIAVSKIDGGNKTHLISSGIDEIDAIVGLLQLMSNHFEDK